MDPAIEFACELLSEKLINAGVDNGHSLGHAIIVMEHAAKAIKSQEALEEHAADILFAALLHDADDEKFFPAQSALNAREIIEKVNAAFPDIELNTGSILSMISLVSASKNKNSKVEAGKEWMLIPRWCDRLEAIGTIGLDRTISYAKFIGNPMTTKDTPAVFNDDDLARVAPYSRFLNYNGQSPSIIDHIYDKVLHIGLRPEEDTINAYLLRVSSERTQIIKDFLFNFWQVQSKR